MNHSLFGGFPGGRLIGEEELAGVVEVVTARSPFRFYGTNPQNKVSVLESSLCKQLERSHAICVSSGTAALHVALAALRIGKGDEVVVPAYAWSADVMAILAVGATPVIAPVDERLGIDISRLEECLSERTRAIIAVHMRGVPCDIVGTIRIAKRHGVMVLEDGSQCFGGMIQDRPVGSYSDISVFSFQYNKLITGGEGGALLCNDAKIFERARPFHDQGMVREPDGTDPEGEEAIFGFGLNYRLSELPAAMILAQLEKVSDILERLIEVREMAVKELSGLIVQHDLVSRPIVPATVPNNAYLCLQAQNIDECLGVIEDLKNVGIPAYHCGRVDPHHFRAWTAFLERDGHNYRSLAGQESIDILDRTMFLELNSTAKSGQN